MDIQLAAANKSEDLHAEFLIIRRQYRATAAVAVAVLSGGAVFYHFVQHLSWINAFYFCTITLTTIGYGDITPKTDAEKLFTIFYVLAGVGIIAFFANVLIKNATIRREMRRSKRKANL